MGSDVAIDLGTSTTLVYVRGRGVVLNEPTVMAVDNRTSELLAIGHHAWQLIGRAPKHVVTLRPLDRGAVVDFDATQRMIRVLLERSRASRLHRSRVLICVPSASTEVERRAVEEAARRAGAGTALLIEQPMAAAIGAGLPVHEPLGNMVVDVGGGTTETSVISVGGIVAGEASRVGGSDIDRSIAAFVRREFGVTISERIAEEVKFAIGSATGADDGMAAEVRGTDVCTGLPRTVVVWPQHVREAMAEHVDAIVGSVVECLSRVPPELAQDLIGQGIHLLGGGALLRGLATRLAEETALPVHLVDSPRQCVVVGAGRCLESFDSLRLLFSGARP